MQPFFNRLTSCTPNFSWMGAGPCTVFMFTTHVYYALSEPYILKKFSLHPSPYLLVSWASWDWLLMWLTNRHPSVLRYWLGHLTRKIISKMTRNVSSGTLNPTIPYTIHILTCITVELIFNTILYYLLKYCCVFPSSLQVLSPIGVQMLDIHIT